MCRRSFREPDAYTGGKYGKGVAQRELGSQAGRRGALCCAGLSSFHSAKKSKGFCEQAAAGRPGLGALWLAAARDGASQWGASTSPRAVGPRHGGGKLFDGRLRFVLFLIDENRLGLRAAEQEERRFRGRARGWVWLWWGASLSVGDPARPHACAEFSKRISSSSAAAIIPRPRP